MRPHKERLAKVREKLFLRLVAGRRALSVVTLDETLPEYFAQQSKCVRRLDFVPDPADLLPPVDRLVARRELGLNPTQKYILCYGHIDARKGICELLQAITGDTRFSNVDIIVAGQRESSFAHRLGELSVSGNCPKVVHIEKFVNLDDERKLFSASDLVWVGYKEHFGSSGVLAQAAAAGLPVIACNVGLIGFTTARYRLGICVDVNNSDAIRNAIIRLLTDDTFSNSCRLAAAEFSRVRTPEYFANEIFKLLEQRSRTTEGVVN
jgi:glycosyltransferase involved in cell wall biosynthesis